MALNYFTATEAIRIHDKIIEISGGIAGVKTYGNLESPLEHIRNDDYYPAFEDKLTHLVFSFNKSHAFNDGNKRTSIAMGAFFLEVNGLDVFVNKFILEMENVAVTVADNIIDKSLLHEIICSIITEEDFNEALKLKIIYALEAADTSYTSVGLGSDFYKDLF